jgi:phosphatidylserine decarboxylase
MCSWAFNHSNDVFYFENVGEVNGIKVPFTIGIQIPSQLQSMVSLGNNGVVSMDAIFNTNDVKFHLLTLMVFDAHHIAMPIAWIITSCQTFNDLVK